MIQTASTLTKSQINGVTPTASQQFFFNNSQNMTTKKYNSYSSSKDKRVYLGVHPSRVPEEAFSDRVSYVLGSSGLVKDCLGGSAGLIFPYTPKISFSHSVNYEQTDIIHSNISINHYKNTPSPTIDIEAPFTASTEDMAKHMLGAIWFLRSCTKCDFGEQANFGNENSSGVPPPILYLHGWNDVIQAVPVILKGFNYTYPDDVEYVLIKVQCGNKVLEEWLPISTSLSLKLEVQYNIKKFKKEFNLDKYKSGILFGESGMSVKQISNGQVQTANLNQNFNGQQVISNPSNRQQTVDTSNVKIGQNNTTFDKSGWTW